MTRIKKPADDGAGYSERRQELDRILAKLQDTDCDVDEAAGLYEQAVRLIGELEAYLQQAENRIEKVQADFAAATEKVADGGDDIDGDGIVDRGARG
jgi:exodeoxyribonuclease VII small subunit